MLSTANASVLPNVPTLRDKAICVRLTRRMFNPYKYDEGATAAAEASAGTIKAGRFNKRLLRACPELKAATAAYTDVYRFVMDNTLPWMDEGVRVLPNQEYFEFLNKYRMLRDGAKAAVQKLYAAWDQAVQADQRFLAGMWKLDDYPTKDEMLERWDMSLTFSPVPSSEDFRIDMDDEDKNALDEAVRKVEAGAGDHLLREILKPVAAMAEKLAVPIGKEGSVFRDSLVLNLKDVVSRARKLNISDDGRVESVIRDIEQVTNTMSADGLRASPGLRASAQSAMADVQKKIDQWL